MKLSHLVERYISHRRALGLKFNRNATILRAFQQGLKSDLAIEDVSLEETTRYLYRDRPVTRTWHGYYSALKGFFNYAIVRGYLKTSPLTQVIPNLPPKFIPYIYTRGEVRSLLSASDSFRKIYLTMEPTTMRVLILLLYATGLRGREAISLNRSHVDLDARVITVVRSKFYKSRLVPFTAQLIPTLRRYLDRATIKALDHSGDAPFFTTSEGHRISQVTMEHLFRRICKYAGILRRDGASYQPRIHDLRHTFAVHRLMAWYRQGKDVQRLLPHLSVYLGHDRLAATQVYLSITPEVLAEANRRFERYATNLS